MGKVRIHMMMSLDGYVAGTNQRLEAPFGDGAEHFLDWVFKQQSFSAQHGGEGGATGATNDVLRETMEGLGAHILGRHMFGGGTGEWPEPAWDGWWGPNPPYHHPVFVLTHHPRAPLAMEGGTTFTFVTDGIESALRQAQAAAGDLDVRIGGGGEVADAYLRAGLVDEIELHIVPWIMGDGVRLFSGLGVVRPRLEQIRSIAGAEVTHITYRIVK